MSKFLDDNGLLYFWGKIKEKLNEKVNAEIGKGLSTNDYSTSEKNKLAGIEDGANKTTVENVLTSTSTTNALSANQGKVLSDSLKDLKDSIGQMGGGDMLTAVYDKDKDGVVDNSNALNGHIDTYFAQADGQNIKTTFTQAESRTNIVSTEPLPTTLGKVSKFFADTKQVAYTGSYNDLIDQPTIPSSVASFPDAKDYAKKEDLSSIYKYKGSVDTYEDLATKEGSAQVGDVYNVIATDMNYGWTGSTWDSLGQPFQIESITNGEIDKVVV